MRYLIAVAEELSFTRAAERCNVSQPPLSRAIRDLELEIGAQLFERDTHHVALTPAGESLVEQARHILLIIDDAADRARRISIGLSGTLTIGFGGSTTYSLLPSLVRAFRAEVPDVELRYQSLSTGQQIEALRNNAIDLGIVRLPIFDEMLETCSVHREPLVVALPTGHPLLNETMPIDIALLKDQRLINYEPARGFNFHADLVALCRAANFEPKIVHVSPSTEAVIGIVACGEGVAIVPASAERLHFSGVAFRPIAEKRSNSNLTSVNFGLAWNKFRPLPARERFVQFSVRQIEQVH